MRPGDTDAKYWLGVALERQGRWKEAVPAYESTAKKDRFFLDALVNGAENYPTHRLPRSTEVVAVLFL